MNKVKVKITNFNGYFVYYFFLIVKRTQILIFGEISYLIHFLGDFGHMLTIEFNKNFVNLWKEVKSQGVFEKFCFIFKLLANCFLTANF